MLWFVIGAVVVVLGVVWWLDRRHDGQVDQSRVGRHNQIQAPHNRGRVHERASRRIHIRPQRFHREIHTAELIESITLLQRDQPHARHVRQGREMAERHRAKQIVAVLRVTLPADADLEARR